MNQWSCHQYFCCCCTSAFSRWWHMPHTFTPRWLHTVLYSLLLFLLSQFPMSLVLYHQTFSATNNFNSMLKKKQQEQCWCQLCPMRHWLPMSLVLNHQTFNATNNFNSMLKKKQQEQCWCWLELVSTIRCQTTNQWTPVVFMTTSSPTASTYHIFDGGGQPAVVEGGGLFNIFSHPYKINGSAWQEK